MKELPELHCASRREWEAWLEENHSRSSGVWLRLAKKGSAVATVSRADALEVALCYGWIDGQAASIDDVTWRMRFTPRTRRSRWSRINRDAAIGLIETGLMKPAGLAEVEAAKADGRWDAAYESPRNMTVPDDLRARLEQYPRGWELFEALNRSSRYSMLYHIHHAKRPETRARRIEKYVAMLLDGRTGDFR